MSFLPAYVETSAVLKLVVPEPESESLRLELGRWPDWITSELTAVECHRALRRERVNSSVVARAEHVLAQCAWIRIDGDVLKLAACIGPRELRSLDAIHLATALSIGDCPEAFITYDERLARAARGLKLNVLQPGLASQATVRPRAAARPAN